MERMNAAREEKGQEPILTMENRDVMNPHSPCFCCCLANDSRVVERRQHEDDAEEEDGTAEDHPRTCGDTRHTALPADLCSSLWNWSKCFCFGFVGCWCQCFGMCAVGQEDREMQRLLSKQELQLDYVTFEPYSNYYPRIASLRDAEISSFREHATGLSKLSCRLLQSLGLCILILAVVAISQVVSNITPVTLLVFLATFFQAFFVLYFLYWRLNRFDISFDAVVKYFSSGFIICTGLAFAYEILVQIILNTILYVVAILTVLIAMAISDGNGTNTGLTEQTINSQFVTDHEMFFEWAAAVGAFSKAFLMAAFVEEFAKYFGYWMIEHPDFLSPADMVVDTTTTTSTTKGEGHVKKVIPSAIRGSHIFEEIILDEETQGGETVDTVDTDITKDSDHQEVHKRSLVSMGTTIMVAMVTTALGFACCENLIYIFGYGPSGVSNEISILAMRSLLPLHPIAAAIQSIGVIRRDIEGDMSYGIGRIIFPAFLYHGSFDFVLMFMTALDEIHLFEKISGNESQQEEQKLDYLEQSENGIDSFYIAYTIFVLGIVYYVIQARAQRKRLIVLDTNCHSSAPVKRLV